MKNLEEQLDSMSEQGRLRVARVCEAIGGNNMIAVFDEAACRLRAFRCLEDETPVTSLSLRQLEEMPDEFFEAMLVVLGGNIDVEGVLRGKGSAHENGGDPAPETGFQ